MQFMQFSAVFVLVLLAVLLTLWYPSRGVGLGVLWQYHRYDAKERLLQPLTLCLASVRACLQVAKRRGCKQLLFGCRG